MYNIKEIAALIKGEIKGDDNLSFLRLSPFFHACENELTFAADEKMTDLGFLPTVITPYPGRILEETNFQFMKTMLCCWAILLFPFITV